MKRLFTLFIFLFAVIGLSNAQIESLIFEVNINGFTAPVWGEHPDFDLEVPSDVHYGLGEVEWKFYSGGSDYISLTPNDVFNREDGEYRMTVSLFAAKPYGFDMGNCTAYLNGDASICISMVTNYGLGLDVETFAYRVTKPAALSYHFEEGTLQGWTNIDADGDGNKWKIKYDNVNHSGHNSSSGLVISESWHETGALTPDNYLVSPEKGRYEQITFWACAQDESYPAEHFGVAVSTKSNTNAADFTTVLDWTMTAKQGTWYKYTVDLSSYAGKDIWVAIRHFGCSGKFILNIDDIELARANSVSETGENIMSVYPNPTRETIRIEGLETDAVIEIYNNLGALVKSVNVAVDEEINVSELASGVYMVRCGRQTTRFIKE